MCMICPNKYQVGESAVSIPRLACLRRSRQFTYWKRREVSSWRSKGASGKRSLFYLWMCTSGFPFHLLFPCIKEVPWGIRSLVSRIRIWVWLPKPQVGTVDKSNYGIEPKQTDRPAAPHIYSGIQQWLHKNYTWNNNCDGRLKSSSIGKYSHFF